MSTLWPVIWHDSIDSTNEEAKRLAASPSFTDQWIAAREQTAGRGRLKREWKSPIGNLFNTALFREPGGVEVAVRIPFAAALATADVVSSFAPDADIKLKWPNDVRINRAKVSGILIETGRQGDTFWVAAGIGINVTHTPEGAGQQAVSIAELRGDDVVTAEMVQQALRERLADRLDQARQDFSATRRDWLERAEGLGETIQIKSVAEPLEGVFETLSEDCGLVLRLPDGERRTIRAGDVSLIGDAG